MRLSRLFAAMAAGTALSWGSAQAATYAFTYTSNIYSGSGTLITQDTLSTDGGFSGYLITSMSGEFGGASITGISTPGGFGGNDNLLHPSGQPNLDGPGLTFSTTADLFNLFYSGGYVTFGVNSPQDSGGVFSVREIGGPAPEPAAWIMLLMGFGAAGAAMRGSRAADARRVRPVGGGARRPA